MDRRWEAIPWTELRISQNLLRDMIVAQTKKPHVVLFTLLLDNVVSSQLQTKDTDERSTTAG
jgi:hypothetical protein